MKKLFIYILTILTFFVSPRQTLAWTNADGGIQTRHTSNIPHLNSKGTIQNSFTSDSFFPLSLYWYDSNRIAEIAAAGFNTLWAFDVTGRNLDQQSSLANQYGIKIIPDLRWYLQSAINAGDWTTVTNFINGRKNNPELLSWMLTDEGFSGTTNALWLQTYNTIKAADPNRAVMGEQSDSDINNITQCFPLKTDMTYIYSYSIHAPTTSLGGLTQAIDGYMNKNCPWPMLVLLQSFRRNPNGTNEPWPVMPSPQQIRGQAYAAIAHGATGIGFFVGFLEQTTPGAEELHGLWPGTSNWTAVSVLNHEIESNKKVFLSKTSTDEYHIAFNRSGQICIPQAVPYCSGCGDPSSCHEFDGNLGACAATHGCNEDFGNCAGEYCRSECGGKSSESCMGTNGCTWNSQSCSNGSPIPLHTLLKDTGEPNTRYLLAVNIEPLALIGQYTFMKKIVSITSVFDNRTINKTADGVFADDLPMYDARLYKIIFEGTAPTPTPTSTCLLKPRGDLDCSGIINIYDYNILVNNFGATGVSGFHAADLKADGVIDIFDYNILVSNFGAIQ